MFLLFDVSLSPLLYWIEAPSWVSCVAYRTSTSPSRPLCAHHIHTVHLKYFFAARTFDVMVMSAIAMYTRTYNYGKRKELSLHLLLILGILEIVNSGSL